MSGEQTLVRDKPHRKAGDVRATQELLRKIQRVGAMIQREAKALSNQKSFIKAEKC